MISSDSPVFSLHELSTDLKNRFSLQILVKPRDFVAKYYINIYMGIVIYFFWDSRFLRPFLYFRSETGIGLRVFSGVKFFF